MGDMVEFQFEDEEGLETHDPIFEKAKEAAEHLIRWNAIETDYFVFKRWCPEGETEPRYGFVVGIWKDPKNLLCELDTDLRTPFDAVIVRGDGYVYDELIRRLY